MYPKLKIEKCGCYELSQQISNKLNNSTEILKDINNDNVNILWKIKFACKLGIDPNDFNGVHRRRLVLKRLDLISNVNNVPRLVYTTPVSTASNERAFSQLKMVKSRATIAKCR